MYFCFSHDKLKQLLGGPELSYTLSFSTKGEQHLHMAVFIMQFCLQSRFLSLRACLTISIWLYFNLAIAISLLKNIDRQNAADCANITVLKRVSENQPNRPLWKPVPSLVLFTHNQNQREFPVWVLTLMFLSNAAHFVFLL